MANLYARIAIPASAILAAQREEQQWESGFERLGLSVAQRAKYRRRASGSRFYRRVIRPEFEGVIRDITRNIAPQVDQ